MSAAHAGHLVVVRKLKRVHLVASGLVEGRPPLHRQPVRKWLAALDLGGAAQPAAHHDLIGAVRISQPTTVGAAHQEQEIVVASPAAIVAAHRLVPHARPLGLHFHFDRDRLAEQIARLIEPQRAMQLRRRAALGQRGIVGLARAIHRPPDPQRRRRARQRQPLPRRSHLDRYLFQLLRLLAPRAAQIEPPQPGRNQQHQRLHIFMVRMGRPNRFILSRCGAHAWCWW